MAKREEKAKPTQSPMEIREIPVESINLGPQMIRHDQDDDDVIELAGDIAAHGLLQPVGVSPVATGLWQLLWGSRRLAAFRRLHRPTIPARVCDAASTEEVIATAVRENILRRQLTLAEEIDALRSLTDQGLSPSQISDLCGKSRNWVDRRLAFNAIPLEIRDHVIEGNLPLGHAEALTMVEDPGARQYLLSWTLANRPTLAALRSSIEAIAATPTFGEAVEAGAQSAKPQSAPSAFFVGCHTCTAPTEINAAVVVRVCRPCADAMAGAAAPIESEHGHS